MTLAALAALALPLAGPAVANHGARTLQVGICTDPGPPECPDDDATIIANEVQSNNEAGVTHTLRAVLSTAATAGSTFIQIDFEISGSGTYTAVSGGTGSPPDAADSRFSPDLSCDVTVGADSCEVAYTNTRGTDASSADTDTIRGWIDHDKNNATDESDPLEGRNSDPNDCGSPPPSDCSSPPFVPGSDNDAMEPDDTDIVSKEWDAGAAATLDCNPEQATNPATTASESEEIYTCRVEDAHGNPVDGVIIDGENMNGANDPDNSDGTETPTTNITPDYDDACTTGDTDDGECDTDDENIRANEGEQGLAQICFWADTDADSVYDPNGPGQADGGDCDTELVGEVEKNDLTDKVEKVWEHRRASSVDAEPETDTNDINTPHTITATAYDQFGSQFNSPTVVNFEFFTGSPSDPAGDGNSPQSPDKQCTTSNQSGIPPPGPQSFSCSVTYSSARTGTDLVCVWINNAPGMTGNNTNGMCDGEGLNDPDDVAGEADPHPANDDQDVVQKIWNDPATASRLDCEPETDSNPVGTAHTITCTATNDTGGGVSGANIDGEMTGANDPDGNSPTSPDFTCNTPADDPTTPTTNEAGRCSFTHGPGGTGTTNSVGLTSYRFWIDSDKDNATTEADASEGRDETATAGSKQEPDDTDVVEKNWVAAPASLTMTPESDTANVGTCNAYTITVLNAQSQPAQGATIDVEQRHERAQNSTPNDEPRVSFCTPTTADGPNPSTVDEGRGDLRPPDENPDNVGTAGGETVNPTDAQGKVTIGIRVDPANNSDGTGTVNLSAFFETTDNDDPDSGEPQDTSTKTWQKTQARTIDCTPDSASNAVGTQHVVTCTVRSASGTPAQGEGVTFTESGPGSVTPTQATTDQNGQARTTATSSETGQQTITGTITADTAGNEPSEVDECDRPANDPQGAPAGQCSDSVTKNWTASNARTIDCEPETGTNETGIQHVVTCTVRNAAGQPAPGEGVTFTETGPGSISPAQATTDQSGVARTTATSTEAGTQTITGTITADTQGAEPGEVDECDRAANDPPGAAAGACADSVEKTWTQAETECNDGVDNDGDGKTDFPSDPDCESSTDDSETHVPEDISVPTNLSIRYERDDGDFKGAVGSSRQKCRTFRRVTLKKERPGRDRTVGTDTSNRFGDWRIHKARARGRYYAKVAAKTFTAANGDRITCLRDRSNTIRVRRR